MTEESPQDEALVSRAEASHWGDSVEAAETPARRKSRLAIALAGGIRVDDWACENSVPPSTAYRWAALPEVKAEIRECRRSVHCDSIDLMTRHSTQAAKGIADLAKSESVKLAAMRSMLLDVFEVTDCTDIQDRITALLERWSVATAPAQQ
jgi:hypothetical protein